MLVHSFKAISFTNETKGRPNNGFEEITHILLVKLLNNVKMNTNLTIFPIYYFRVQNGSQVVDNTVCHQLRL